MDPLRRGIALSVSMCIIHTMNSADLIRLLKDAGWEPDRIRGSHHVFRHAGNPNIITVPHPKKDLGKGLVNHLLKLAGIR